MKIAHHIKSLSFRSNEKIFGFRNEYFAQKHRYGQSTIDVNSNDKHKLENEVGMIGAKQCK